MIEIVLPSRRKKTPFPTTTYGNKYSHAPNPMAMATKAANEDVKHPHAEVFMEACRRDRIIRSLTKDLPYKEGDRVYIKNAKEREKYGKEIYISKIVRTYGGFGKDEVWPKSDIPMIVHCYSKDKDIQFFCTTNYVTNIAV
jgi:hypothetical protein